MKESWDDSINEFLRYADEVGLRIILVGGGAVNFHGYQRHSADLDFWIDNSDDNLAILADILYKMGFSSFLFPETVRNGQQNISLKFSPLSINVELITAFSINKSFNEAWDTATKTYHDSNAFGWKVLSYEDLVTSKIKSGRPKDLLDIQELQRQRNIK